MDFQAVVRRAGGRDRLQSGKAPDAVIDMHDEVAGRETGRLGDEIVGAAHGAARPHQTIAQNVLLADDGRVGGLETEFDAEDGERHRRLGQAKRLRP